MHQRYFYSGAIQVRPPPPGQTEMEYLAMTVKNVQDQTNVKMVNAEALLLPATRCVNTAMEMAVV